MQSLLFSQLLQKLPVSWLVSAVLGMKVKQGKSAIWLFFKISLSITISMESSRRDLFSDVVFQKFILKEKAYKNY